MEEMGVGMEWNGMELDFLYISRLKLSILRKTAFRFPHDCIIKFFFLIY